MLSLLHDLSVPVRIVNGAPGWESTVTAISTGVLALFGVVALCSLWDAQRTRHAQILLDMSRRWDEQACANSLMMTGRHGANGVLKVIQTIFDRSDTPDAGQLEELRKSVADMETLSIWANLVETIGVLCSQKALSEEAVFKQWAASIVWGWKIWEPATLYARDKEGREGFHANFQKLAEAMDKRLKAEAHKAPKKPAGDGSKRGAASGSPEAAAESDTSD